MIEIVAVSHEDGWAYVRVEGDLYLIHPPYHNSGAIPADEDAVEKAVGTLGFSISELKFQSWHELASFLHDGVAEARRQRGRDVAEAAPGREFLRLAPVEDLSHFLDCVEGELIPQRKLEHAENVLLAMLNTPEVQEHRNLMARAAQLMRAVCDHRAQAEEDRRRLAGGSLGPATPNGRHDTGEVARYAEEVAKAGPFALAAGQE